MYTHMLDEVSKYTEAGDYKAALIHLAWVVKKQDKMIDELRAAIHAAKPSAPKFCNSCGRSMSGGHCRRCDRTPR